MYNQQGSSSREAPSQGHGGMMSSFLQKMGQHTTTDFPPSPISPDDSGSHGQQYGAFDQGPTANATQMLPTPDTPTTKTYFQGSHDPKDFVIDLMHTRPEDFEVDVKTYLECMGRFASGQPNGYGAWLSGLQHDGYPQTYQPDHELVSSGLNFVREQYRDGSQGLWVQPDEITAADMQQYPHYPWMGALIRKGGDKESMLQILNILKEPLKAKGLMSSQYLMVPGNVRMALPSGLSGPTQNKGWLAQIGCVYGNSHPAWTLAAQPWYTDENLNDSLLYSAARFGEKEMPEITLPDDPELSDD